jgi:hypothetical protein
MAAISIFIAGAKDLADQRMKLKAMISDMNHRNAKMGVPHSFDPSSYETFGNDQEKYNEHITNSADLVLFVLEGRIGKFTEDEYRLATRLKGKRGVPDVVVMLKAYDELTPDISYINGLMRNDNYYITYKNDDDLILKAKSYLEEYVKIFRPRRLGIMRRKLKVQTNFKRIVISVMTVLLLLAGFIGGCIHQSRQPILLIAGGGSAKNYIEKYYGIDFNAYRNACYVHLPSRNAWQLLTEEMISPTQSERYCPVCISASEAKDEDFTKITTQEAFIEKGFVISKFLGEDMLVVSVKNDPYILSKLAPDCIDSCWISMDELIALTSNPDSVNIYATCEGSGTHYEYLKAFAGAQKDMTKIPIEPYSEDTQFSKIDGDKPYVLFGSQSYSMKEVQRKVDESAAFNLRLYKNVDGKKQYYTKPIYLYFYAQKSTDDKLSVKKSILQLLEDMNLDMKGKVKKNQLKRHGGDNLILDFDRLQDWREDE